MTHDLRIVAVFAVLMALVVCVPVQAQTPEIDALRERAEQGDAEAQTNLGDIYSRTAIDSPVPRDGTEAARWCRLAAEQGDADAQFRFEDSYGFGLGVPQDDAEAVRWYRLAAYQGNALSHFSLGYMYALGEGVPRDYRRSVTLVAEPRVAGVRLEYRLQMSRPGPDNIAGEAYARPLSVLPHRHYVTAMTKPEEKGP